MSTSDWDRTLTAVRADLHDIAQQFELPFDQVAREFVASMKARWEAEDRPVRERWNVYEVDSYGERQAVLGYVIDAGLVTEAEALRAYFEEFPEQKRAGALYEAERAQDDD